MADRADEISKRDRIVVELEDLVGDIDANAQSPAQIEKLKAGLSLVIEAEKAKIADASEDDRAWLEIVKGITPIAITGLLGLIGSGVTLLYQAKQHEADERHQQRETHAAADRQGQQLQETAEAAAHQERTQLLESLAQSVSSGPMPAASCWYVQGIWADYSKDEPLPEVLADRCRSPEAAAAASEKASDGAQWVVLFASSNQCSKACDAAREANADGLENVQVLEETPPGYYRVTAGQFSRRLDATGYLQRVRSVRGNASVARQVLPRWTWIDCSKC